MYAFRVPFVHPPLLFLSRRLLISPHIRPSGQCRAAISKTRFDRYFIVFSLDKSLLNLLLQDNQMAGCHRISPSLGSRLIPPRSIFQTAHTVPRRLQRPVRLDTILVVGCLDSTFSLSSNVPIINYDVFDGRRVRIRNDASSDS